MYECEDLVRTTQRTCVFLLERPAGDCCWGSGACSLQDLYRTHKYTVWAECSFSVKPGGMNTDQRTSECR
jgi:hypothetical protein